MKVQTPGTRLKSNHMPVEEGQVGMSTQNTQSKTFQAFL